MSPYGNSREARIGSTFARADVVGSCGLVDRFLRKQIFTKG
jgi:hypothetical protein